MKVDNLGPGYVAGLFSRAMTQFFPPCWLKNALLRSILGWRIGKGVRIGHSQIEALDVDIGSGTVIGNGNRLVGLNSLSLGINVHIGISNTITCNRKYAGSADFIAGKNAGILRGNILDVTGGIKLGSNVVLGGVGSQLWTHGFDIYRNRIEAPIVIGDNVYIGSGCLVNLGVKIPSETIIGMGSVVAKSPARTGCFWAGNPATLKGEGIDFSLRSGLIERTTVGDARFYVKRVE